MKFVFGSGLISIPVSFDIAPGDSGAFFGAGGTGAGTAPAPAAGAIASEDPAPGSRLAAATPEGAAATEPESNDGPEFSVCWWTFAVFFSKSGKPDCVASPL